MKRLGLVLLVLFSLSTEALAIEKLTAGDWPKITRQRKIYFVLGTMEEF